MARCSICHTLIQETDERTACPTCRQEYHASCWQGMGGCATYGCEKAVSAEKPAPPKRVGAGWGDAKTCPSCRREIGASLLLCGCGAKFPYADPMTPDEYKRWRREQDEARTARRILLVLFLLSLIGLLAPFCGAAAAAFAYSRRALLAGADGTYLAMGYGAGALGFTYAFVILVLMLGG